MQLVVESFTSRAIALHHYSGVSHGATARRHHATNITFVMPLFWIFVEDLGEYYIVGQVHGKHNVEVHAGVPGERGWF